MKYPFILTIIITLLGCSKQARINEKPISKEPMENGISDKTEVPESLYGSYINVKYLESLRKTKSTLASQEVSALSYIDIKKDGTYSIVNTFWNFHEGGNTDTLFMKGSDEAEIITGNVISEKTTIQIKPNGRILYNRGGDVYEMIKFSDNNYSNEEIINKTLFEGKYRLGTKTINLTSDGRVIGIDSINKYYVNTDYIDAGMDFDMVFLSIKGKTQVDEMGDEYGYVFKQDTLEIFNLDCQQYSPDDPDLCIEHKKGQPLLILVKEK